MTNRFDAARETQGRARNDVALVERPSAGAAATIDVPGGHGGVLAERSSLVERSRASLFGKRALDIVAATLGLLLLSPYLAYVAIRIKRDSPGPVLFRQPRVGRHGKTFTLLKFRTMSADADARKPEVASLNSRSDGLFKVENDPRVTRYGRRLRRFSLDELPQLVNVLRGEMSLVGPRPLIPAESDLVSGDYRMRFAVRPGITGPWQAGPIDVPLSRMLELDCDYALGWTVRGDIAVLFRTVLVIVRRRGSFY